MPNDYDENEAWEFPLKCPACGKIKMVVADKTQEIWYQCPHCRLHLIATIRMEPTVTVEPVPH